jgi:small subunit ribosomal protein S9
LKEGSGNITVNGRDYKEYFPVAILQYVVRQPLEIANVLDKYDIKVTLDGGGFKGQAEAVRLAISRALVEINEEIRPALKAKGLMRRDPRMVERKKPGQPKARKRFQFSKR